MKRVWVLGVALVCCVWLMTIFELSPTAEASNNRTHFIDVPADAWYHDSAYFCYETGVFVGDQAGRFQPDRAMTSQEGYAILARLRVKHTGGIQFLTPAPGEGWSEPYLRYCVEHKIISEIEATGSAVLTREDFTKGLSRIYDGSSFQKLNDITSLADYTVSTELGQFVLALYQAGILNGTDTYGCFSPIGEISRAECATIITRLMDPRLRLTFEAAPPLTMELNFLTTTDTLYAFDGAYLYILDTSGEAPSYRVVDLYGRTLLQSKARIGREESGIFRVYDQDTGTTAYYNVQGELILSWADPSALLKDFAYGKLAVKQNDGSILVVDTQGQVLKTVVEMNDYRVVGAAFGNYIPVAPENGRKDGYSYWLDLRSGAVQELPYDVEWSLCDTGHGYLVVSRYDEAGYRWFYNAVDTSLNLVFPQMMESAQVLANGVLWAEDDTAYYVITPGAGKDVYIKSEWGTIRQFSPSGRVLTQTGSGMQVRLLKTGQTFFSASDGNNYTLVGRKLIRPYKVNDETVVDILDESGVLEQKGVPAKDIWYGSGGQILYIIDNKHFYISA